MANKKITDLTALTAPAATDVLPIIDQSESAAADKNKKIAYSVLLTNVPAGSASTPSLAFVGDPNTGLAANGADGIQLVTGGAARLLIADTGVIVPGNLEVQGTTTTIDTTNLTVKDKNIEIAKGNGNDAAVDGAGITIDSTDGDKTWNWVDSTDAWTSSENIDLASGKVLKVAGTQVLSATQYTGNAATATSVTNITVSANNSTDETVYPLFVDGATGTQGAETDTGLNYNPSTGNLTSTLFTGNLTGNVTGNTSGTAAGLSGTPNITVTDVVAASLDISGNADIDGTLETDALTIDGTALNEYIADTVGAMVSSNTESDITVVYQDADNTLDFTVGNISGTAGGLTGTPNITVADVIAASLDISGNADIDGTLEADAYTVNGTALNEYIADTVGAMVSSNTETNITVTYEDSDNTLDFVIGTLNQNTTGTAGGLSGTPNITVGDVVAASLDISGGADIDGTLEADAYTVDGVALNEYIADTVGAMVGSNTETGITVTYEDSDNTLDFVIGTLNQNTTGTAGGLSGTPNITVGDVVAASLDISGNVDVDGTLETDALTINGTSLAETIADTVGAMVGSNTETGITVTYEDSDNTLDFVIGTLNQDTTGNAATATALETARTIGGTSFDGTANITPANATNAVNVTGTVASAVTGTTQSAADNSTKIATTAYVETAVSNLVDSAPGTLNTLNELAAALGDDASFSTTVTNSIATKVPLSTIDTKGDIYVGTANDTVTKLAAGSNGQVLKANSSEATGLEWATISTTDTTYSQSFVDSSNDIILRLAAGGSGSGNDDVKFVAGSNITLTHTDADNITIAASGGEVTVQDEGSALSTAATTLNFTGSGVTASGSGATKTINISGGTANHKILTLRNSANNGAADLTNTDFTLVTSGTTTAQAVVSAQQLLVSVNGVIQQPNAGSSTSGLDGFVIDTGTTGRIKFSAAPGSGADIFIVLNGEVVDIGTPSDNAVDLAQLAHATQGDVLYYGASGVPARLSAGTSGYFLKTQGSGANPVWAAVPASVTQENVEDWVGGMVTGNTETGITVTYEDSDGTLDFVVGTLNQDTTGTADHVTIADNESTNENNLIAFVEDAQGAGSRGLETDGDFHYNPSTGTVTATAFAGSGANLTGIASTSLDGCGYQNDQTISAGTYTIAANKGMHSVGPITNNGTVTVNGTWLIS
tara:strand:- start:52 stop:3594 length:3543 start_codon:yes stop_codon:yes gene_type:complete